MRCAAARQLFFEVHKRDAGAKSHTLYRSEYAKCAASILFRTFSLHSTDMMET